MNVRFYHSWQPHERPPPFFPPKRYQSVYEVKRFVWKRWVVTRRGPLLTFLIAICFLSFVLRGERGAEDAHGAPLLKRERGLCLVLAVACMLRAKLRDQWQRGCYHSTRSRHSSGGEGRRWGGWWWGGPWWFILIGAQSFVLKGEGERQAVGSKSPRIS